MIDIIELKETVSFEEAAKWLSEKLHSSVSVADIFDLAAEEKITISIKLLTDNIHNHRYKKICHKNEVDRCENKFYDLMHEIKHKIEGRLSLPIEDDNMDEWMTPDPVAELGVQIGEYIYALDNTDCLEGATLGFGVYDFAMVGAGKADILRIANQLKGACEINTWRFDERNLFMVLSDDRKWAFRLTSNQEENPLCDILARHLYEIDHADYVIRTSELKRFCAELLSGNKSLEPIINQPCKLTNGDPLYEKERANLHRVIHAMKEVLLAEDSKKIDCSNLKMS